MLMPAAVLVFLVLGAICVDFGSVYSAQRELADAAAAAANDAATRAIDLDHFYATGDARIVQARAWAIAEQSVAAKGLDRLDAAVTDVHVDATGTRVVVTVSGRAHYLFAKVVPGGKEGADIHTSSEAEAREEP
jgi:Flp pilus assembly protein TadG